MLSLLLDEHLSPAIARQLRSRIAEIRVLSLREWEGGAYLQAADDVVLVAAGRQQRTLVTYDQRTIVPLLKAWGERGLVHGGVILVDTQTLAPNDIGGLVAALALVWERFGRDEWTNRVVYLTAR